jgi:hypothetical protein
MKRKSADTKHMIAPSSINLNEARPSSKKSRSAYRMHREYGNGALATGALSSSSADVGHTENDARITEHLVRNANKYIRNGQIPVQARSIQRGPKDQILFWTKNRPDLRLDVVLKNATPAQKKNIYMKIMNGVANLHALGGVANRDLKGTTPNIFVYPVEEGRPPEIPRFTDFGWV